MANGDAPRRLPQRAQCEPEKPRYEDSAHSNRNGKNDFLNEVGVLRKHPDPPRAL
jgi:hypothetical protein